MEMRPQLLDRCNEVFMQRQLSPQAYAGMFCATSDHETVGPVALAITDRLRADI